jgi:hypothetical protein
MAENIALRESVRDLTAKSQGFDSEYWRWVGVGVDGWV